MTLSHTSKTSLQDTTSLVNAFLENCRNRGLSQHSIRWYEGILIKYAQKYPELPDRPEQLEAYIGSYISGDERRHGVYRVLRCFHNFTSDRHDIVNPMKKVKPPRVLPKSKKALSLDQIRQVLNYHGHTEMMKALLYLLIDTGSTLPWSRSISCTPACRHLLRQVHHLHS